MKKKILFVALVLVAAAASFQWSTKQEKLDSLMLENIEALAKIEELPEVVITCSRTCSDGIGQCYRKYDQWGNCHFSGYQFEFCTCG